ncbi:MAG: MFS transporter, partial [Hyphomicrobium sp.]
MTQETIMAPTITPLPQPLPPFFGTTVVRAAFVLAFFGWGVGFYGPPIFLHTVVSRTGWSLALVSGAVTFHFLFGAAIVVLLPRLYGRFGIPRITISGAACLAVGVLGWSLARSPFELFGSAALTGGGWVTMGAAAINAIVSPWYAQGRPLALAKSYNGASVGGIVCSSLLVLMISKTGFTATAYIVGVVMLCIVGLIAKMVLPVTPGCIQQSVHSSGEATALLIAASPKLASSVAHSVWVNRQCQTLAGAMAL